ncbi:hypothetical protein HY496_03515 [Candidatus Woesearchaeota archaeon]|nr:hypothetical protein [Candidatus Woesearchaeota archaeon]
MPPMFVATAIAEIQYLHAFASDVDKSLIRERVLPVFTVFTQHLKDKKKQDELERIVDSVFVLRDDGSLPRDHPGGLNGFPASYKRASGAIVVAESEFNEKGYLEWAFLLKMGDFLRIKPIIRHPVVTANAVASFYLDMASEGLPQQRDGIRLWAVKYVFPTVFQGEGIHKMAYRMGNEAKQRERETGGSGLQYIYELTR